MRRRTVQLLTIFILSLLLFATFLFLRKPAPALADGPCGEGETLTQWQGEADFIQFASDNCGPSESVCTADMDGWERTSSGERVRFDNRFPGTGKWGLFMQSDDPGNINRMIAITVSEAFSAPFDIETSEALTAEIQLTGWADGESDRQAWFGYRSGGGNYFTTWTPASNSYFTKTLDINNRVITSIYINEEGTSALYWGGVVAAHSVAISGTFCAPATTEPPEERPCALVNNPDFADFTAWMTDGYIDSTAGTLTLDPGRNAYQNISGLDSNTTYDIELIIDDEYPNNGSVKVSLGDALDFINVTGPGTYTTTLKTGTVNGPVNFGLNVPLASLYVTIDFVCISMADTDDEGNQQTQCLAPSNGTFDTDEGWDWHWGAQWLESGKALLPPAIGMIIDSSEYNVTDTVSGEWLILAFDARGDGGKVVAQIEYPGPVAKSYMDTHEAFYRYEIDASDFITNTVNGIAIANNEGSVDVEVDNVCLYISDRAPRPPYPVGEDDGEGLYTFTSCADIDGYWSYFGVNMAQYRADYFAGFSFWDEPIKWLVSAIFVTMADWSCMFVASYIGVLNTLKWINDNVINYILWATDNTHNLSLAMQDLEDWLIVSANNIIDWFFDTTSAFVDWQADQVTENVKWYGEALEAKAKENIAQAEEQANWWRSAIGTILGWYIASGGNIYGFWGQTLGSLAAVIKDGSALRTVFNAFAPGWNALMDGLGMALGQVIDALIGVWNNSLSGFASKVLEYILGASAFVGMLALLSDFVVGTAIFLWTIAWWLWANAVAVWDKPLAFYYGFESSLRSEAYLPFVTCDDGGGFWCLFLVAVQLINHLSSHSIFYPIVIIGMILSTILIIWRNINDLFSLSIK